MPRQNSHKRRLKRPFPSSRIWAKIILNCNMLIPNWLHCPNLVKKNVVKLAGFSYVHCQLHRMVPGQTGFALRRVKRETRETLTNNKPNNIGGTR
jgi:hypothetical protein